jgi:hypothetical protein
VGVSVSGTFFSLMIMMMMNDISTVGEACPAFRTLEQFL